jgi:hypothetical protein
MTGEVAMNTKSTIKHSGLCLLLFVTFILYNNFAPMRKRDYPYLNLELKSLPGERWKDIPGLNGMYQVSSFGRVKRSKRESRLKNKVIYPRAEMIIKPELHKVLNAFKHDYSQHLTVRVAVKEIRYNYSIARLVFTTFKEGYDYDDKSFVVISKDNDTLNLRLSNLKAITLSEKAQRIKDLGRTPNPFHKLSPKQVKQRWLHMLQFRLKPVIQYSLSGKKIKEYESIEKAAKAVKGRASAIGQAAKGHQTTSAGFKWKYKYKRHKDSL